MAPRTSYFGDDLIAFFLGHIHDLPSNHPMEWPTITGPKRGIILAAYALAALLVLANAVKSVAEHFRPTDIIHRAQR